MVSGSDIAKEVGIPATTCRDYLNRFKPFFIGKTVSGSRWPMYPDNAVEIMKEIVAGYKTGLMGEEITEALSKNYPRIFEEQRRASSDDNGLTAGGRSLVVSQPATSLDIVADMMAQQYQTINRLIETVAETQKQMVEVLARMEVLIKERETTRNTRVGEPENKPIVERTASHKKRKTTAKHTKQKFTNLTPKKETPAPRKSWWQKLVP